MVYREYDLNWELSFDKILNRKEVRNIRSWAVKNRKNNPNRRIAWIDWFLIELSLNSGLRVFEIADLECRDIVLREELSHIVVRKGKCGKRRIVRINTDFQEAVKVFMNWKHKAGEKIDDYAPLFFSPRSKGKYSTRGLQKAFKRCIVKAGIPAYHSIHHLRHTFASLLYVASNSNARLIQKQLGHSSIQTTQVYLNLFQQDVQCAVENLF